LSGNTGGIGERVGVAAASLQPDHHAEPDTAFTSLTPPEQSEALQCVLKGATVHPQKLALQIFELEEFDPCSQNRKEWLALADDFRTLETLQFFAPSKRLKP
jgi:hypothetical protein